MKHGFIRSHRNSYSAFFRFVDLVVILSVLGLSAAAYGLEMTSLYVSGAFAACIVYLLVAESLDVYRSWRGASAWHILSVTAASWIVVCLGMLVISFFAKISENLSRVVMGSWMLASLVALLGWRLLFRQFLFRLRKRGINARRAAVVGINQSGIEMRNELVSNPEHGYLFAGFFDDRSHDRVAEEFLDARLDGSIDDLVEMAQKGNVDTVFVALPLKAQKRIDSVLKRLGDSTISVHLIPDFFTYNLLHARFGEIGQVQTISVYETPIFGFNDFLKRAFDIVFSMCVLLVISPLMLAIAFAVKFSSPGPVIFKQYRYGLDGRKIQVWKFRSMTTLENGDRVVQAKKNDKRVTRVGAFIRRTSLDELPQFVNVLQGRMSVVGPRPHAVAHNEEYRKIIPYYMLRHKVKPGITGWAQVNGFRGETDTLDKMSGRVDFDLDYIRNWSLWMDLKIVFLTFFKGFTGKNVH
ncbi:MAG: undecaprenyl-phosphate glucose phosphotransferase [Oceanospirillaceae bacterium]|nr:undecaprenyl-phosphate glucose phosphotransferase [Oceanospirillaceae bacterium]